MLREEGTKESLPAMNTFCSQLPKSKKADNVSFTGLENGVYTI